MIKISILYPNSGRFDMDYYLNTHMPRSIELLSKGKSYRGVSVERGVGGASPGSAPSYVAMCHYLFDTADDFMAAFLPPPSCRATCRTTPTLRPSFRSARSLSCDKGAVWLSR